LAGFVRRAALTTLAKYTRAIHCRQTTEARYGFRSSTSGVTLHDQRFNRTPAIRSPINREPHRFHASYPEITLGLDAARLSDARSENFKLWCVPTTFPRFHRRHPPTCRPPSMSRYPHRDNLTLGRSGLAGQHREGRQTHDFNRLDHLAAVNASLRRRMKPSVSRNVTRSYQQQINAVISVKAHRDRVKSARRFKRLPTHIPQALA